MLRNFNREEFMKIFIFGASLRKGSLNKKLASKAAQISQKIPDTVIDYADFREFEMPVYDGDLEAASGIPEGAKKFIQRILASDAMIISTPEYNGGMPGALKNALDWASRSTPMPVSGKPLLLLGASPGAFGAVRSLWHTRVPFEAIGTLVFPEMFGLPKANTAFDEAGEFVDAKNQERLEKLVNTFVKYARNINLN
jgi:chromate reductase